MSDTEKPMALDLASTAELREQLFAARDALFTEGLARNEAEAEVKRLRALLDRNAGLLARVQALLDAIEEVGK